MKGTCVDELGRPGYLPFLCFLSLIFFFFFERVRRQQYAQLLGMNWDWF